MILREATEADLPAILAIYADEVLQGFGTFEYAPPTLEEMTARFRGVAALGLPYLVAEVDGAVAAYAYASAFRPRTGYRFTVEDSVYVARDARGRGLARTLLDALIVRCEALGMRRMLAVIGDSGNAGSVALHRACGFEDAGVLTGVGYKHGRWVDVVMMQRTLGAGDAPPDGDGLPIEERR